MADSTRRRLLHLLALEELNVSELVEILRQPQSTVSRHLKILREADLIRDRRDGTSSWYSLAREAVDPNSRESAIELPEMVLTWLRRQTLAPVLEERMRRTIRRREGTAAFFNRLGKRWDDLRTKAFGSAFAAEAFVSLLPHNWVVADIGSGTGYLVPMLARQFAHVHAIEPAEAMLACARQRASDAKASNVSFHKGGLESLPIASAGCDLALAVLVIHHVEDPSQALREIARIVRPGGRAMLVEQEAHENQAFYERMQDLWWGFAPDELARKLSEAGFADVRHRSLSTISDDKADTDAPPLFVITGERNHR